MGGGDFWYDLFNLFNFLQLDALPDIVDAVKDTNIEVYMDGGVRTGNDVFKALALGARAVFVGRPSLWGVAVNVSLAKDL